MEYVDVDAGARNRSFAFPRTDRRPLLFAQFVETLRLHEEWSGAVLGQRRFEAGQSAEIFLFEFELMILAYRIAWLCLALFVLL